jgi:tetratricopeptide (TPR) repeat protein
MGIRTIKGRSVTGNLKHPIFGLRAQGNEVLRLFDSGDIENARQLLEKLKKQYPNSPPLLEELIAKIAIKDEDYSTARQCMISLLAAEGGNAKHWHLLGLIERLDEDLAAAIQAYTKAINLEPTFVDALNDLGIAYRYIGKYEDSIATFRKVIANSPNNCGAYYNLSVIRGFTFEEHERIALLGMSRSSQDNSDKARCCFALYRTFVQSGDFDIAFTHLLEGNRLVYKKIRASRSLSSFANRLITTSDLHRLSLKANVKPGPDAQPIFIVGMPRSGSSLLEKVLTSHSEVGSLGEHSRLWQLFRDIDSRSRYDPSGLLAALDGDTHLPQIQRYRDDIALRAPGVTSFVDKTLNHFRLVGYIKQIFPCAKFIHIKRNPMDTCFGCFEMKFTKGHEYAFSLDSLADEYKAYTRLMHFWQALLPEDILEVRYEDLTQDSETTIRRCFDFIGLPMEEQCLQPELNESQIITASTDQVREAIHTNSIGRWRRFESQLQGLNDKLRLI